MVVGLFSKSISLTVYERRLPQFAMIIYPWYSYLTSCYQVGTSLARYLRSSMVSRHERVHMNLKMLSMQSIVPSFDYTAAALKPVQI